MTVEEVERLSGTIGSMNRRLAAAAVSYCWETREHPDPEGNSFLALADALEKCYEEKGKDTLQIQGLPRGHRNILGLPVSFSASAGRQAHRGAGSGLQGARAPPLLLLLCCSHALHLFRHTHARSLASTTSIWSMRTRARPSSGSSTRRRPPARLTYARAGTTHTPSPTLCRHSPQQRPSPTTADLPPTHCQPSSLHSLKVDGPPMSRVRAPPLSLSLPQARMPRLSLYPSPSPHRRTDASRILKAQFSFLWPAVIDVGESAANDGKVPPPPSIAAFREKVKTLHFTNGADKPVVAGLYEKMLRAALGGSTELSFDSAGWGDAEAVAFAESLPLCTRLEELNVATTRLATRG